MIRMMGKRDMRRLLLFTYLAHFHPFENFVRYSFRLFLQWRRHGRLSMLVRATAELDVLVGLVVVWGPVDCFQR